LYREAGFGWFGDRTFVGVSGEGIVVMIVLGVEDACRYREQVDICSLIK
jgi:hypothetical protein